jgi:hypothetical protein
MLCKNPIFVGEVVEVALEQHVASEGRFDRGLLCMRARDGDSALAIAYEFGWLGEFNSKCSQVPPNSLP